MIIADQVIQTVVAGATVYAALYASWIAPGKKRWSDLTRWQAHVDTKMALLEEFRKNNRGHRKEVYDQLESIKKDVNQIRVLIVKRLPAPD